MKPAGAGGVRDDLELAVRPRGFERESGSARMAARLRLDGRSCPTAGPPRYCEVNEHRKPPR
jgi:hypothetical protein